MAAPNPFVLTVDVSAPIEKVWQAWASSAVLDKWLCEKSNVAARAGGQYELFWDPAHRDQNSTLGCSITAIKENEHLAFNWKGPVMYADLMNTNPLPTSVSVDFTNLGNGSTRVKLVHAGWGKSERWLAARSWQENAWKGALDRLRKRFEH